MLLLLLLLLLPLLHNLGSPDALVSHASTTDDDGMNNAVTEGFGAKIERDEARASAAARRVRLLLGGRWKVTNNSSNNNNNNSNSISSISSTWELQLQ